MAEDSQADYVKVPSGQKQSWATPAQKILFLMVGLIMLGLVAERWSIYNLNKKIEGPGGPTESSENVTAPPSLNGTEQVQQRPFAHLVGSRIPQGENTTNVLQWIHENGEAILSNMGYNDGRLLVQKDGFYYIYSKVTANAAEECSLILHKVLKVTKWYNVPIELMKSKNFRCPKPPSEEPPEAGEDLWDSFQAGIFHLQSGDEIFVTLDDIRRIRPGPTETFMGAFMI